MADEYAIEVTLFWGAEGVPATVDDVREALVRSGIVAGSLIGECMIESIAAYPLGGDDD